VKGEVCKQSRFEDRLPPKIGASSRWLADMVQHSHGLAASNKE